MNTTINGVTYTQDANGDWNGSDGSTFTNADFLNYAAQPVNFTGNVASASSSGGVPVGAVGTDSTGTNWIDKLGNILAPIAATALSPAISNLQSGGLLGKATDLVTAAGNSYAGVNAPDLTRLIPQLQLQVMQGQMTPAQAAAAVQQASAMAGVNTDQASLQGQRAALAKLAQIGENQGMTEADRAALAETMNQTNANAAQQRAAQIQQLQMQGNAGTGAELAARLTGAQGSANANALAGAQSAQAAQARALAAIQAGLQGNAALNTQQFSQAAQKAQAQDLVNQFNAQAQQSANLANAGYQQQANANNFNTANTIAGTNTGIMNTQAMMPYQAAQANFTNQAALAKDRANAQLYGGKVLGDMAQNQIKASGQLAGTAPAATGTGSTGSSGGTTVDPITGAIKNAVGSVVGDVVKNGLSDAASTVAGWFGFKDGGYVEPHKGEMCDRDIDEMIAKLTAYKYRRK